LIDRRDLLAASAALIGAAMLPSVLPAAAPGASTPTGAAVAGRLRQSVSRWPFAQIPLRDFCRAAKAMGLAGIDLLQPAEWDIVRGFGLVPSMGYPADRPDFISTGFNDPKNHAMLLNELERAIPLAAAHGVPNVITMFGNRHGLSDDAGADNCITGLSKIKALAEEHRVTVCVELLNSRVDHKDYMGDRTAFGVRVMRGVGSPRVKLLYDIYHMQIMEGDVIRTIRDNREHIGHFHTGGVPGRHELDGTQELNYRAIATAIAETGFDGFVAHEFEPTRDPLISLREAVAVCRV
jgi:hydroxypyruvate isomerase